MCPFVISKLILSIIIKQQQQQQNKHVITTHCTNSKRRQKKTQMQQKPNQQTKQNRIKYTSLSFSVRARVRVYESLSSSAILCDFSISQNRSIERCDCKHTVHCDLISENTFLINFWNKFEVKCQRKKKENESAWIQVNKTIC